MTVHDPDVCSCANCIAARLLEQNDPRIFLSMNQETSSVPKKPDPIEIAVIKGKATIPLYVSLFHKYFEKSNPTVASSKRATLVAPLDQLDMLMMDGPARLTASIESIEIHYEREGA